MEATLVPAVGAACRHPALCRNQQSPVSRSRQAAQHVARRPAPARPANRRPGLPADAGAARLQPRDAIHPQARRKARRPPSRRNTPGRSSSTSSRKKRSMPSPCRAVRCSSTSEPSLPLATRPNSPASWLTKWRTSTCSTPPSKHDKAQTTGLLAGLAGAVLGATLGQGMLGQLGANGNCAHRPGLQPQVLALRRIAG